MKFISIGFLIFLASVFLAYYLIPKKYQWIELLAASYVFYCFAGIKYIGFILVTTLSTYFVAKLLEYMSDRADAYVESHRDEMSKDERKEYRAKQKKKRFLLLCAGLVFNFGILAALKYTPLAETAYISGFLSLIGISFYMFQTMGYLIDVYRSKTVAEKNVAKFALFVSFFPQLVQGPISRYGDLAPQLFEGHDFDIRNVSFGIQRIIWGFFKKLVIADRVAVAVVAMKNSPDEFYGLSVLVLIIFYSINIYADFTGGMDIAIGVGETLGIKMTENFKRPFFSKSTKEYWNRWHITMGSWFTDYVFYPLSVCTPMRSVSKKCRELLGNNIGKRIPMYIATVLTWLLTGVWHGSGLNFIVWGLLNGVIILVSEELSPLYKRFHNRFPRLGSSAPYVSFMMFRTFFIMGIIRILDVYRDVGLTFRMWGSVFVSPNPSVLFNGGLLGFSLGTADYMILAIGVILMFAVSVIRERSGKNIRELLENKTVLCAFIFTALIAVTVIFGVYGNGYDANQFIYNQF